MKLRNLFLATLAAGLFTACSTDDVPTPNGGGEEAMVNISMAVTDGSIVSKAEEGSDAENYIGQLTMFAFTSDGAKAESVETKATGTESIDFVGDLLVPAGVAYDIVIVANGGTEIEDAVANLDDLKALTWDISSQLDGETAKNLLMVSKTYSITPAAVANAAVTYHYLREGTNHYTKTDGSKASASELVDIYTSDTGKYNIPVTRQVARIELESLTFSPTLDLYTDAQFTLESVFLVNMRKSTYVLQNAGTYEVIPASGTPWLRGGPETFVVDQHWISENSTYNAYFDKADYSSVVLNKGESYGSGNSKAFVKYAFESYKTTDGDYDYSPRLVIAGKFKAAQYPNNMTRYYHVILRDQPVLDGANRQIERNTIYRINATITGIGSTIPDGGSEALVNINAKVVVVDWNVVDIVEDNL